MESNRYERSKLESFPSYLYKYKNYIAVALKENDKKNIQELKLLILKIISLLNIIIINHIHTFIWIKIILLQQVIIREKF